MSQEIINISSPDDGLGDALRNGFNKTNQNFTELYNNKVDKVAGKGLSENDFTDTDKSKLDGIEAGAQVNVQSDFGETDPLEPSFILNKPPSLYAAVGYFLHNDLATQTTPISVLSGIETRLTNDTDGAQTDLSQAPYLVSDVWISTDNYFDFEKLSIGDTLDLRVDILLTTTSANQKYKIFLRVGEGSSKEKDLIVTQGQIKTSSTDEPIVGEVGFSIDYQEHIDYPTYIYIVSDDDADVKVNGWYTRVIRKGLNVIDITGGGNWGDITGDLSDQTDLQDALDAKLDKVSTSGVERAYIINADGSQGTKATSDFGGGEKEKVIFYNRSTWTFPNVAGAPFPLISSTNFEVNTANLNSATDNALTAMNNTSVVFVPIGVAPFGMKLKRVILEGRQTFASWQGFNLRCVVGSNRTEQTATIGYSHLDSQVVEDFTHSMATPINSSNLFVNRAVTSSVVIPQNHGVILMMSYSRTGASISPVISTYLEFEKE